MEHVEQEQSYGRRLTRVDLLRPPSEWGWRDLRDYAVERLGSLPTNGMHPAQVAGVLKSFLGRWGADRAKAIVDFVADVHGGVWRGEQVGVSRFTKGSDPHFARIISSRLNSVADPEPRRLANFA